MYVRKITGLEITCPHCGSKITMTWDEYDKYRKEMEGYGGSTITCQREGEDGKNRDIEYTNFDCPSCNGYIPVTVADGVDADNWGFVHSNCVNLTYGSYDKIEIGEYINRQLGNDEVDESEN